MEDISHAHIVSSMYKLVTLSRGSDDWFIGFERDRNKKQREITEIKNVNGKHHVRIMLKNFLLLKTTKESYLRPRL